MKTTPKRRFVSATPEIPLAKGTNLITLWSGSRDNDQPSDEPETSISSRGVEALLQANTIRRQIIELYKDLTKVLSEGLNELDQENRNLRNVLRIQA